MNQRNLAISALTRVAQDLDKLVCPQTSADSADHPLITCSSPSQQKISHALLLDATPTHHLVSLLM